LTEWLAGVRGDGRATAWLSLDQRDNDPALFWTYVVAALRTAVGGIGAGAGEVDGGVAAELSAFRGPPLGFVRPEEK
jgi:ATP/maltotriose-dependent transcriptional regulator MalT